MNITDSTTNRSLEYLVKFINTKAKIIKKAKCIFIKCRLTYFLCHIINHQKMPQTSSGLFLIEAARSLPGSVTRCRTVCEISCQRLSVSDQLFSFFLPPSFSPYLSMIFLRIAECSASLMALFSNR